MSQSVEAGAPLPEGAAQLERYAAGGLRSWVPRRPSPLYWRGVTLIPQYEEEPPRRMVVPPVCLHENGALKSITLQEPLELATPVGRLSAERLTFHADGSLRRLFPAAGKPSATWTEEDEKARFAPTSVQTPLGRLEARLIGVCFFPRGALRSVTLWPGEVVALATPLGTYPARIGVAFYESGALRAFEPARPIQLPTPVGPLLAFHALAVGIHGDCGSVELGEDGTVKALLSETDELTLRGPGGLVVGDHGPREIPSRCEEEATERVPLALRFDDGTLVLDGRRYRLDEVQVTIRRPTQERRTLPVCH